MCRKLFYEKGYIDTYYNDISKETSLSPGVIHYHFKSKKNIASIIYNEFMSHNKLFIGNLLGNKYDLQIATAVELRNYMDLCMKDENMKRFYSEICMDRVIVDSFTETGEYFFKLHRDAYDLKIRDDMLKIINITSVATETELMVNYLNGTLETCYEDLIDFNIKLVYELMSIDYKRIDEIIEISRDVYSKFDIRMKDYFQLELI